MDVKTLLTNPLVTGAAGGIGGYFVGKKYIKKNGGIYGALGGALAGYVVGRLVAPKRPTQTGLPAAAARSVSGNPELGEYGDFVEFDDVQPVTMPGASAYHSPSQAAQVARDAAEAVQPPPPDAVESTADLSEGWNGDMGSMSGGLGEGASDDELDELIAQAQPGYGRSNGSN